MKRRAVDGAMRGTCFFFFSSRRRHTRFDCDWSSDVCSSDLSSRDSWKVSNRSSSSTTSACTGGRRGTGEGRGGEEGRSPGAAHHLKKKKRNIGLLHAL